MKKSLLALAVLGAFAGAASAQSSVTLFGVVDLSGNDIKNGNAHTQSLQSNQLNSNRIGFRGIEDLGGGLKAGFWLEAAMNNENGNMGGASGITTPSAGTSQIFNRRSTVSLFSNWGELRLGRDYDASFWNLVYDDVNGANGLGQGLNLVPGLSSSANSLARVNGSIGYFLPPNLGGLYGQATVSAPSNNSTSGTPATNQKYYGGRLGWSAGPFDVNVSYGETELNQFKGSAFGDKYKIGNFGGSWDFGVAKIYGFYNEVKFQSFKADTYEVSVGVPLGNGEFRAVYGHVDQKGSQQICGVVCINPPPPGSITSIDANDADLWSLEYVYNVSKRTALYTTFGEIKNKGKATFSVLPTAPSDAALAGGKSTGYNVGIRHSF
jgi:predicted porin